MVPLGGKCQRRAINTQFHAIDRLRCVAKLCHIHLIFASMRLIFNTGSFSTCRPDLIAWQEECVRYSWDIFTMGQQESEGKKDTHTHTRRVCHIQSQIFCIILVRCQAPAVLLGLMRKCYWTLRLNSSSIFRPWLFTVHNCFFQLKPRPYKTTLFSLEVADCSGHIPTT